MKVAVLDYAKQGAQVNAVAPGPIDTDPLAFGSEEGRQIAVQAVPMRRPGRSDDVVGAAALWLCIDHSNP